MGCFVYRPGSSNLPKSSQSSTTIPATFRFDSLRRRVERCTWTPDADTAVRTGTRRGSISPIEAPNQSGQHPRHDLLPNARLYDRVKSRRWSAFEMAQYGRTRADSVICNALELAGSLVTVQSMGGLAEIRAATKHQAGTEDACHALGSPAACAMIQGSVGPPCPAPRCALPCVDREPATRRPAGPRRPAACCPAPSSTARYVP